MVKSMPLQFEQRAPENLPGHTANAGRKNLILIGFMGVGKSTVGEICARELGYAFCDTDAMIEAQSGRSIATLFAQEGETAFRKRERELIAELTAKSGLVIATGGGAPLDPINGERLRAGGMVVLLTASPQEILRRIGDTRSRPLLAEADDPGAKIDAMLRSRNPVYREAAHHQIRAAYGSPKAVAAAILQLLEKRTRQEIYSLEVPLGARSYTLWLGSNLIPQGGAEILAAAGAGRRACIVTHPRLRKLYAEPLAFGLRTLGWDCHLVTVPAGEQQKVLRRVEKLYGDFLAAGLDRKSLVVAVGGGVLGDLVGFAAATYLRGVRFAQAPTTLLAQVDSSIGGKTGVDLPQGKNLVGAFHQPCVVLMDPATLQTLPIRELRAGLAEVIKYGIIYDEAFLRSVANDIPALLKYDLKALTRAIARSCEIKAEVVAEDETEQGLRAILNFGHTVGHALETVTHYRSYRHGEAISIGMVSAALIGETLGLTPPEVTQTLRATLAAAGLPTVFPAHIDSEAILEAAQRDKKTEAGRLRFVLADRLGSVTVVDDVPSGAVREALQRQKLAG